MRNIRPHSLELQSANRDLGQHGLTVSFKSWSRHLVRSGVPLPEIRRPSIYEGRKHTDRVDRAFNHACRVPRRSFVATKRYPDRPGESVLQCIEEGWEIVGCSFERGSIEQGLANQITLVLTPPPEHVYFGD